MPETKALATKGTRKKAPARALEVLTQNFSGLIREGEIGRKKVQDLFVRGKEKRGELLVYTQSNYTQSSGADIREQTLQRSVAQPG